MAYISAATITRCLVVPTVMNTVVDIGPSGTYFDVYARAWITPHIEGIRIVYLIRKYTVNLPISSL